MNYKLYFGFLFLFLALWIIILPSAAMLSAHAVTHATQTTDRTFVGTTVLPSGLKFNIINGTKAPRAEHTATLLRTGKVLLVGGRESNTVFSQAELFDPSLNSFALTGSLNQARSLHTATLLPDGRVLIAGGFVSGLGNIPSSEIYDPVTGLFTPTGSLNQAREQHVAVLLQNGKVLVAGGWTGSLVPVKSAELYDPSTGIFTFTGSMSEGRPNAVAALLPNDKVLVAGGNNFPTYAGLSSAEVYDPNTGTFQLTGSLNQRRRFHAATSLADGRILIAGGNESGHDLSSVEVYDPASGVFTALSNLKYARAEHTVDLLSNRQILIVGGKSALPEVYHLTTNTSSTFSVSTLQRERHETTLLNDGSALITGGCCTSTGTNITETVRATPYATNTITGWLTLPQDWLTDPVVTTVISATSAGAIVTGVGLAADNVIPQTWHAIVPGEPQMISWDFGSDGSNKAVTVYIRDSNNNFDSVVTGTVKIDSLPPVSSMSALAATSPSVIALSWSGIDPVSGIAGYDVQVRSAGDAQWRDIHINIPSTSTLFFGEEGKTYAFRVRAQDVAGNQEDWSIDDYVTTTVDGELPVNQLLINGGATTSTARNVTIWVSATDTIGSITSMRFSEDGLSWQPWQTYMAYSAYELSSSDGAKTLYTQVRDQAGNISQVVSDTIQLDEAVGQQHLVSTNNGSIWTNMITVTLNVGAPVGTMQMQISNDGGFGGAMWQPYNSHPIWQINGYGDYVLPRTIYTRLRLADNSISSPASDEIIYDPIPPVGTITITSISPSRQAAGLKVSGRVMTVSLNASDPDNLSGVPRMRIAPKSEVLQTAWVPYSTSKTVTITNQEVMSLCAQFQDGAGNISSIVCTAGDSTSGEKRVYLPIIQQ